MKFSLKKFVAMTASAAMLVGVLGACQPAAPAATAAPATEAPAATDAAAPTDAPAATDTPAPTDAPAADGTVDANSLPRDQTLYFGGLQWGASNGWNPLMGTQNNSMVNAANRVTMFETLYMYNMLDGKLYPLLADGDYQWNADQTEMTVKIKAAAKWNDGTPVTADDVAYSWAEGVKYQFSGTVNYQPYISDVIATDPQTLTIKCTLTDDGKPANPLQVLTWLTQSYVLQKTWYQTLEARCNNDGPTIMNDPGNDVAYSGPYGPFFSDNTKLVLVRNDNYWGQDASMWGKLPVPKYLCHVIYADNNATQVALANGQVDVDQQFVANVQDMWEKQNLPISTYMQDAPYGICVSLPTVWYNLSSYGLDNVAVRKAIAIATDYDSIIANAMTNQSPTFSQVPRSLMNPTPGEQALYDSTDPDIQALQWAGNDIDGAKKLLDDAGIVDTDGDGYRELNGQKLTYVAACPNGWTDWMATIELVAAAGQAIGIDITTNYPEADPFEAAVVSANQTDYDIFMMWTDGAGPAEPWARIRNILSSEFNGQDNNWSGNWGHYSNPEVDALIKAIPLETDPAKLKADYTTIVKDYLTDVPSFTVMYRPDQFHVVNESVWTGFTSQDDGRNVPPGHCTDGYAIADLYNLSLVQQ